ncbi:hypothetical protein AB3S75_037058 [Citrus x aurantiifolia]
MMGSGRRQVLPPLACFDKIMLGFKCVANSPILLNLLPIYHQRNKFPSDFRFKSKTDYKFSPRFILFAQNSKNDSSSSSSGKDQENQNQKGSFVNNNGDDIEKDRPSGFNLKWGDILNPDPDNIFAVGLTGLLTWASVQVLWQLLTISLAILVAALKYSFIAALLILILITLL